jgi:hypothetical protein
MEMVVTAQLLAAHYLSWQREAVRGLQVTQAMEEAHIMLEVGLFMVEPMVVLVGEVEATPMVLVLFLGSEDLAFLVRVIKVVTEHL